MVQCPHHVSAAIAYFGSLHAMHPCCGCPFTRKHLHWLGNSHTLVRCVCCVCPPVRCHAACGCLQGALTALPLRCLWALCRMLTHLLLPGRRQPGSSGSRPPLLPGAQLYDLLCALLMLGAVVVLSQIKPGVLYYWMKDITSEFLKIQVLFTALEILDKVRASVLLWPVELNGNVDGICWGGGTVRVEL